METETVAGQLEVQASFEICGVRCVNCEESAFTHVTLYSEAVTWGENHQGHTFEMDCFYTKPPELAGKRCRISVTPKE
jgi:hypothetical protein